MELVLNTFGTSLNRDNEGFVISAAEARQRIPAEDTHAELNEMMAEYVRIT